jgi:ParB-like chromosome segregation protein Spo0J
VLEVQLIENLHRNDLTPLEQARGYRALIASNPTPHEKQD